MNVIQCLIFEKVLALKWVNALREILLIRKCVAPKRKAEVLAYFNCLLFKFWHILENMYTLKTIKGGKWEMIISHGVLIQKHGIVCWSHANNL